MSRIVQLVTTEKASRIHLLILSRVKESEQDGFHLSIVNIDQDRNATLCACVTARHTTTDRFKVLNQYSLSRKLNFVHFS